MFANVPLPSELFEDLRKRLDGEDVLRQLGEQGQVSRLQATAAQDVESAVLGPLSFGGGQVGRGGILRCLVMF